MLKFSAIRHLDANLSGVYPRSTMWSGPGLRRLGKAGAAAKRQQFMQGVGNECLNQIMGRPAGLP
jgi:hypothetical protein